MEHLSPGGGELALPSNRSFGLVFAAVFTIIGLFPLASGGTIRVWALAAGGGFLLATWASPGILTVPNRLWMRFGALLHRIVSPVVMGLLFFAVITPFAIVMRLRGRDVLKLSADPAARSYWIERTPPGPPPDSMSNQF